MATTGHPLPVEARRALWDRVWSRLLASPDTREAPDGATECEEPETLPPARPDAEEGA